MNEGNPIQTDAARLIDPPINVGEARQIGKHPDVLARDALIGERQKLRRLGVCRSNAIARVECQNLGSPSDLVAASVKLLPQQINGEGDIGERLGAAGVEIGEQNDIERRAIEQLSHR